jgi:hypothetical protein
MCWTEWCCRRPQTDLEAAARIGELQEITDNDRYEFSEPIRMLKPILAKLGPEAVSRGVASAEGVCAAASKKATRFREAMTACPRDPASSRYFRMTAQGHEDAFPPQG